MLIVAMLAMIAVPAVLTLRTVRLTALNPTVATDPGSSPYGYTVSLLLFIVPIVVIAFWFLPQESVRISKKSFWWTIGLLFPIGAGLDFFFAQYFFVFPNQAATLGIKAPALGAPVPIEEYVFYLTGFLCILLLYIWLDEYWLSAYSIQGESAERKEFHRLFKLHPESIILAIVLVTGAIIYKKHFSDSAGFPGYFIFLALTALVPSSALLPSARPVINWRAFSLAAFFVLLVSLIWEATLAIPYGWWNFRDEQMLGIRITAWGRLPIEEVCLWMAVTYATVIVYETVKCWQASGKSMRHALFG
jgi:lycopene cyclase domain-containing protein